MGNYKRGKAERRTELDGSKIKKMKIIQILRENAHLGERSQAERMKVKWALAR